MDNRSISKIRQLNPLVHTIANQVVQNDVANALLAIGASPIMAMAEEEVAEVSSMADALVLNLGTPTPEKINSMLRAGKAANQAGTLVVLDPVGVGATQFRKEAAARLLQSVNIAVIRGNASEVAHLAGEKWASKGVDAQNKEQSAESVALACARKWQCIVAVSGKEDIITDGRQSRVVEAGTSMLSRITGSGCMLSAVIGAFLAAGKQADAHQYATGFQLKEGLLKIKDKHLTESWIMEAVTQAHLAFGRAGEQAAANSPGPGTFRTHLMDQLAVLTDEDTISKSREERTNR
ncbi:Hydroxyethylthiazole kinase [Alkalibacterium sp. AK22]|uniref:hydroxyethylthiazole kinase n=1 Tax=Alkalibacterium sp. AK22 TaxID=1229520 RepID=UPI00044F3AAA|nr:hydroxyethylthiazole kinase [Alkalibacterium sp. AK22]EXJ24062.1 Hydroxyethylthiazole kinase [Alkalibacterium sp. AK22]